jgi:hypothetical protein
VHPRQDAWRAWCLYKLQGQLFSAWRLILQSACSQARPHTAGGPGSIQGHWRYVGINDDILLGGRPPEGHHDAQPSNLPHAKLLRHIQFMPGTGCFPGSEKESFSSCLNRVSLLKTMVCVSCCPLRLALGALQSPLHSAVHHMLGALRPPCTMSHLMILPDRCLKTGFAILG